MSIILNIVEILVFLVCVLFSIAYLTVAERKTMGYMQRRLGPNAVGYKLALVLVFIFNYFI